MKKYIFVLVLCLELSVAFAQGALGKRVGQVTVANQTGRASLSSRFSATQIATRLQARAQRTYLQALQTSVPTQIPELQHSYPYAMMYVHPALESPALYPQLPFLDTAQKKADYLVSRNNRLYIHAIKHWEQWLPVIKEKYPLLRKTAYAIEQPPVGQEAVWIATQIPATVSDIFLGEEHNNFNVQQTISSLITQIRRQRPTQEIFISKKLA